MDKVAEAWLLSSHKDGKNIDRDLPLLVKLIDAKDNLSVQVHPDDEYAKTHASDNGKTEAWYILDAKDNAEIIYGFKDEITREEFENAIENGTLLEKVNRVKVKPGEVYLINPGTLHAIGKGIFLIEVQRSSNVTYRVYDYKRKDKNGNERELHIKDALNVTNMSRLDSTPSKIPFECDFFKMEEKVGNTELAAPKDFYSIIILSGEGKISDGETDLNIQKFDSIFATEKPLKITGDIKVLVVTPRK